MDEIREKVRGFLAEFTSPDEQDIENFLSKIAAEKPSLELGIFKKNLVKLVRQAKEIIAYGKELSSLNVASPYYKELETVLKEAKEGQKNLEDISEELRTAKRILKSVKEETKEEVLSTKHDVKKLTDEEPVESLRPEKPADKAEIEKGLAGAGESPENLPKKGDTAVKKRKKRKDEKTEISLGEAEGLVQQIDSDTTRELIREQMTPEKHAKFEKLEEKLLSDVETGIKKLKDVKSREKTPETFVGKLKMYFMPEEEEVTEYNEALHGPLVTFEGMEGYNEIERYWVNEPYALVVILFHPEKNSHLYYVAEPKLSDFEDLLLIEIKDRLKDILLFEEIKSEENKEKILTDKVRKVVKDYAIDISPLILEKILYYAKRDFIKFGKIDPLMHDNRIEDISSNGYDIPIYLYHKKYTNLATNIFFSENELDSYVIRLAQRCGKHVSIAEPMVDATMPDGSRIQMTLGTEVTTHGATFTIRKFSEVPITPVDLINWSNFSAEEMAYLLLCIENNKTLIFAVGTASGKTSSLNAVSLFIPWQAKIISLE
ncbi:MAG: type II/IV secretion system ATPase subunit, partial [Candidatus Methanoperedens sp.]|nr:type II/IV secretion system ATPase subunit [Candidatus Methanoperedens sp.]